MLAQETQTAVLRQVYEPETKIILPPTVITKLQTKSQLTALETDETPPQALLVTLDSRHQAVVGKVTLTEGQTVKADTDDSGKADAADALNILKKVVGVEE